MISLYQITMGVIGIFLVEYILYRIVRIQYAKEKVSQTTDEEKANDINQAIDAAGFVFDEKDDYFYSGRNPWQREMGYCKLYDEGAISFSIIVDCEPIYFTYNDKRYLIEIWKGQYGMTTGAEIGVYMTDDEDVYIPGLFRGPFFESVPDPENLYMYFSLKKEGKEICRRTDKHWWLTVFKLGDFSKPSQLTMDVEIMFPNQTMSFAFYEGLRQAGYARTELTFSQNVVSFTFANPKTKQPNRGLLLEKYVQRRNRKNCAKYHKVTKKFTRTIDKITYIRYRMPYLYRLILQIGKTKKMFKKFKLLEEFRRQ